MSDKKRIVMTSGGLGSFITLAMVCDEFGKDNVVSLFADTKMEDYDLYRFLNDTHEYLDINLKVISDGRDVWEVFRDVKFIGNSRIDPCSKILKRDLIDKFIKNNYNPDECVIYIGIDSSEKHRLERLQPRKLPYVYESILCNKNKFYTHEAKIKFVENIGIKPPRLYELGFKHNNCGGFCVKAGLKQFKVLLEEMPDRYEWHVQREREVRILNSNARPFLRKVINGKKYYLWLDEYRDYLLSGKLLDDDENNDWGGCGCAIE